MCSLILKSRPTFRCSWHSRLLFLFVWNWWILAVVVDAEPLWKLVCQTGHPAAQFPFCNATLPLDQRVEDYIHRIPVENQTAMMSHPAAGYDPLGIPPYQWWSEGLHGPLEPCVEWKNQTRCPTSFPCPSGLGNAFNTTLYRAIGSAIGIEGRAISNLRKHDMSIGDGLTYWSPNVNMQRDPRWGRNQEAPGEDPLLTSLYARNFIQGLQQPSFSKNHHKDNDSINVAACCKHFVANSLEHWEGHSRHTFDAKVSKADLYNYYFPSFEECVRAGAAGVMCSYNAVNGIPACIHPELLVTTLRQEWGFDGYVVTDCGALADTISGHGAAKDAMDASAKAKEASVDVNCGNVFREGLLAAYQNGRIQTSTIVDSFRRLARIQFRLGLFDAKQYNPDHDIEVVGSHSPLALEAALQSIVLLKNEGGILPLDSEQTLAMIGPHFNARGVFLSNYNGSPCPGPHYADCIQSPYEAFAKISKHPISSITGCHVGDGDLDEIDQAVAMARDADRVVLFVGLDVSQEQEELDRIETVLPGLQRQLVRAVLDVAPNKTIIVLIHGGAVSLGDDVLTDAAAFCRRRMVVSWPRKPWRM